MIEYVIEIGLGTASLTAITWLCRRLRRLEHEHQADLYRQQRRQQDHDRLEALLRNDKDQPHHQSGPVRRKRHLQAYDGLAAAILTSTVAVRSLAGQRRAAIASLTMAAAAGAMPWIPAQQPGMADTRTGPGISTADPTTATSPITPAADRDMAPDCHATTPHPAATKPSTTAPPPSTTAQTTPPTPTATITPGAPTPHPTISTIPRHPVRATKKAVKGLTENLPDLPGNGLGRRTVRDVKDLIGR